MALAVAIATVTVAVVVAADMSHMWLHLLWCLSITQLLQLHAEHHLPYLAFPVFAYHHHVAVAVRLAPVPVVAVLFDHTFRVCPDDVSAQNDLQMPPNRYHI